MKPVIILGLETSCDETAAALLVDGREVADRTTRQLLHEQYGGVVPELASRAHERLLALAVRGVLNDSRIDLSELSAIAVTSGPGLAGGLLVGLSFAKGLTTGLGIPLIGVNHLEGHIWAGELTGEKLPLPFLALVVSGGHTLLLKVTKFGQYEKLGSTRDDAAGELFDKVGRLLGFHFPAGPALDKDAIEFMGVPIRFPRAKLTDDPYGFSFSGVKTAILYHLRENYTQVDGIFQLTEEQRKAISAGLMATVGDMLVSAIGNAFSHDDYKAVVIGGGVSASRFLRVKFQKFSEEHSVPLIIPPMRFCTDNGSMIAYAGWKRFLAGNFSQPDLSINPAANLFTGISY